MHIACMCTGGMTSTSAWRPLVTSLENGIGGKMTELRSGGDWGAVVDSVDTILFDCDGNFVLLKLQ